MLGILPDNYPNPTTSPIKVQLPNLKESLPLSAKAGAYELLKAVKERATTTYARMPLKYKFKRNTFQIIWKVHVYWNRLLPCTYTDNHAQFRVWICILMARKLHAPLPPLAVHMLLAEAIMSKFPSVFNGQIHTMLGEKFHISLMENAHTCITTPHTVPFEYRDKLTSVHVRTKSIYSPAKES